jgi:hypothetical protein
MLIGNNLNSFVLTFRDEKILDDEAIQIVRWKLFLNYSKEIRFENTYKVMMFV